MSSINFSSPYFTFNHITWLRAVKVKLSEKQSKRLHILTCRLYNIDYENLRKLLVFS